MSVEVNLPESVREKRVREADVQTDAALQLLFSKTPQEINIWLDANVTDLASAKVVMKRMMRLLIYVARKVEDD